MENMNYNFELDENVNMESLKILINQCWKLLPIYEGKSKDNNIVNSKEQAYENYQKHLTFLILNKKELNMSPFVGMSFSQTQHERQDPSH